MDITLIPMKELLKDKEESLVDIGICQQALLNCITDYSGGSVQERLDVNKGIVKKINKEIKRREVENGNEKLL